MSDWRTDAKAKAALDAGEKLIWTVEHGDLEDLRQVFADGAEIWHNTDDTIIGVEQTIKNIRSFTTAAKSFAYTEVVRQPTPTGFVQQHLLIVETGDGRTVRDFCCSVAWVNEEGRITRFDGYHDSAAVPPIPGRHGKNWRTQA